VTGETHLSNAKSMSLWSERILVVLPDGHRLAANEIVHWTDLKGEALLQVEPHRISPFQPYQPELGRPASS